MPKKRYYKKRTTTIAGGLRRRGVLGRPNRLFKAVSGNRIYTFVQHCAEFTAAQAAAAASFGAFGWSLNNLDQVSTFSSLFDAYRVEGVEYTFRPMFTATSLIGAGLPGVSYLTPLIYTVIDYDDSNVPTTLASLREYSTCKCHDDKYAFKVGPFLPRIGGDVNGTPNVFQLKHAWVDAAAPSTPHYGLKYGITAGLAGQASLQVWAITTRVCISFKNTR